MEFPKNRAANQEESESTENGLSRWNDRLDKNLESNNQNDAVADERAKNFSEKEGSGDLPDEAENN